jgi:hypothetical protein
MQLPECVNYEWTQIKKAPKPRNLFLKGVHSKSLREGFHVFSLYSPLLV